MTAPERDRYVIQCLVRVAPCVTILTGSLLLAIWWNGTVSSISLALGGSVIGGGMLWFSYEHWKRHRGYAYLLPSLFLLLHAWMLGRAEPRRLPLVAQDASLQIFVYFLLLWLLTPWLRKQDFLPRIIQASKPQVPPSLNSDAKLVLWWMVTLAPILVILASGGIWYTAGQGVRTSLLRMSLEIGLGSLALWMSYRLWKTGDGDNLRLFPFVLLGVWLNSVRHKG